MENLDSLRIAGALDRIAETLQNIENAVKCLSGSPTNNSVINVTKLNADEICEKCKSELSSSIFCSDAKCSYNPRYVSPR